jgi:hypothetical protein
MKVSGQVHAPAPMAVCGQTEIPHYFTIVHPRYSATTTTIIIIIIIIIIICYHLHVRYLKLYA